MTVETPNRGTVFVLVGPGGTGKNTLMRRVMSQHDNLKQLATATTRAMRPDEAEGREHLFVSYERFQEMIANDELLEYQEVTPEKWYGIPRAVVQDAIDSGTNLITDIEVIGAKILHDAHPDDVVMIFITVPGDTEDEQIAVLTDRMLRRADDITEALRTRVAHRMERARKLELPFAEDDEYIDYRIVNDNKDRAANELHGIIQDELEKRAKREKA